MNNPITPNPPPLTVSQLTNAIKLSLESTFPCVYLQGEISNFKSQNSGHLYFSIKDAQAQIAAVMFKADASLLTIMPKAGDQVIVKGDLNVYPPKGSYQLVVRELAYMGLGELLQKLEMLKIKLHQLGWFKQSRKKPLPKFPKRIGVVTSPTGAVIQDIIHILSRRFSGFHLILNPVKVQGEGAALEIAQAIEQFNHHQLVDVIIVGRGGGSLEDLWSFNEEIVASAIYYSKIPIISAVGHETDHCIADYVADVRAPTPSAAAEIVMAEKKQLLESLSTLKKRLKQAVSHLIQKKQFRLEGIMKHPFITHPHRLIEWRMQKLDDCRPLLGQAIHQFLNLKRHQIAAKFQQALSLKPINLISHFRHRFTVCESSFQQYFIQKLARDRQNINLKKQELHHLWQTEQGKRRHLFNQTLIRDHLFQMANHQFETKRQKLKHLHDILKALNPKNVLKKGYSILFAEKERFVIHSTAELKLGQQARLLMSDGEVLITINKVIIK
ncbi:MAG: exodeoxyribonuclease VII large subunit [Parachlamydiaceae bacterium]